MATTPLWKLGKIDNPIQVSVSDLINSARSFYNNRFEILDKTVSDLQTKKNQGNITDLQFINQLQSLSDKYRKSFVGADAVGQVSDLKNQAQQAVAQQIYNDYIATQKSQIQKTLDAADLQYAAAKDDYTQGRINRDQFMKQQDQYFALQKNRADFESTLPKFSYAQFAPGKALNTYASGRMRDIERERQIREAYQSTFGKPIDAKYLYQTAGSYLPIEAIKAVYAQQKFGKVNSLGGIQNQYLYSEPKYNFPGTGGTSQAPGEVYSPRNYYK